MKFYFKFASILSNVRVRLYTFIYMNINKDNVQLF